MEVHRGAGNNRSRSETNHETATISVLDRFGLFSLGEKLRFAGLDELAAATMPGATPSPRHTGEPPTTPSGNGMSERPWSTAAGWSRVSPRPSTGRQATVRRAERLSRREPRAGRDAGLGPGRKRGRRQGSRRQAGRASFQRNAKPPRTTAQQMAAEPARG